jgi:cytochrome c553
MNADHPTRTRITLPSPVGAFLVVAGVFVLLKVVRPVIPHSVVLLYMGFVVVGVIIHITLDNHRIRRFADFFIKTEGESLTLRLQRWGLLTVIPLLLGWLAYDTTRPSYAPPMEIFQRHPTVAAEILGRIDVPEWAAEPAKWSSEDIAEGKTIYQGNCAVCHGEKLDGKGPAAEGFRYPIRPANFQDAGTIAQLTLPYVYWRLVAGGTQNQFNSPMPRWVAPVENPDASSLHGYDLTSDEAWKVIMYLYDATGYVPRKE